MTFDSKPMMHDAAVRLARASRLRVPSRTVLFPGGANDWIGTDTLALTDQDMQLGGIAHEMENSHRDGTVRRANFPSAIRVSRHGNGFCGSQRMSRVLDRRTRCGYTLFAPSCVGGDHNLSGEPWNPALNALEQLPWSVAYRALSIGCVADSVMDYAFGISTIV